MTVVMGPSPLLDIAGLGSARTKDIFNLLAKHNLVETNTAVWSTITQYMYT